MNLHTNYHIIDMENYPRRNHFEYFSSLAYPYVGLTVNVDITDALSLIKSQHLPFFLTLCYCVSQAANAVPQFRQRILNGQIIEFDHCQTSHTVALADETYCYCTLDSSMSFEKYIPYAAKAQEEAKLQNSIEENETDVLDKFFISSLPWISYTALVQPVPMPADSNPRISWGKYFTQEGRTLLPVSILCHHALVDGVHLARFYEKLDEALVEISSPTF